MSEESQQHNQVEKIAGQANGLLKQRDPLWPGEKTESWIVVILLNLAVPVPLGTVAGYLIFLLCAYLCDASLDPHQDNHLACFGCVIIGFGAGIVLIAGLGVFLNILFLRWGKRFWSLLTLSRVISALAILWSFVPIAWMLYIEVPIVVRETYDRYHVDIYEASERGFDQKVEYWLAKDPTLINSRNRRGFTPLQLAAREGKVDAVKLLLQKGANANAMFTGRYGGGGSALHMAAYKGHIGICGLLLSHGANVNAKSFAVLGYYGNDWTPLHVAAYQGRIDICKLFLNHGADINARGDGDQTPLDLALLMNRVDCARFLLESGAIINIDDPNRLVRAIFRGNSGADQIKLLLDLGFNPNAMDVQGTTPLHTAIERKRLPPIFQTLLQNGADINIQNLLDETPLHLASKKGNYAITELLLKQGADTNMTDDQGRTALHWAAQLGYTEICKILLAYRADLNLKDYQGQTPMALAEHGGHPGVVRLLRQYGGNESNVPHVPMRPRH